MRLPTILASCFILMLATNLRAEESEGCKFFIGEVIKLTEDRASTVDTVIATNRSFIEATKGNGRQIDTYIMNFQKIASRTREPQIARLALNFATTTAQTNRINISIVESTNKLLLGVATGLRSHITILTEIRDTHCME